MDSPRRTPFSLRPLLLVLLAAVAALAVVNVAMAFLVHAGVSGSRSRS